jgi:hypothetical protein
MRDKNYLLGSSEAMKYEPRLDEEHYLYEVGYRNEEGVIESPLEFTRKHLNKLVEMDDTLAKLKVNMQELEDSYLEDSINEQYN